MSAEKDRQSDRQGREEDHDTESQTDRQIVISPGHIHVGPSIVIVSRMNSVVSRDFRFRFDGGALMSYEFLIVRFRSQLKGVETIDADGKMTSDSHCPHSGI